MDGMVMQEEQFRKYSQQVVKTEKNKKETQSWNLLEQIDDTETVQTSNGRMPNAQDHMKRASMRSHTSSI